MRILIVYPYVPYPLDRGTFYRTYYLAKELGRFHEVDLFCLDEKNSIIYQSLFQSFCRRVYFQPFAHPKWPTFFPERALNWTPTTILHWKQDSVAEALKSFINHHQYDLIHFCDLVMWQYVKEIQPSALRVMDRSRVDLLFQSQELDHLQFNLKNKLLRFENLWKLRLYERRAASSIDATIVCGIDDKVFLERNVPTAKRIEVVANGVDEIYFNRDKWPPQPAQKPTILFCGAMDYSPNVNGLEWYFENCDHAVLEKIPERQIWIVGKNPTPYINSLAKLPGVLVTGEVPDVRPYYQQAWTQMIPLLIGGGTRLKIVESLSLGLPVVSTIIGAQGLDLRHEEHLLLAEKPTDFTLQLVRLLMKTELREKLGQQGRQQVLAQYTWGKLGIQLCKIYEDLQKSKS